MNTDDHRDIAYSLLLGSLIVAAVAIWTEIVRLFLS